MKNDQKIIYFTGFLFSIPIALMSYANSSFLAIFIGQKTVGLIYILGSIFSLLMLILVPEIFRKLGGYKFLLITITLDALSVLLFAFSRNALSAVIAFVIGFSLNTLIFFALDEFLKIFSKESTTGEIRGTYLTVCNLAWVVAQFGSATILGNFSFKIIFTVAFFIMVSSLILIIFGLKNIPEPKYDKSRILNFIKKFGENKNLLTIYGINLLLQLFYAWMIIYIPIYLYSYLNFDWKQISLIFAIMLLPFIFVQFPLGEYSDKIGERKILMFGFFVTSVATISLFFIHKPILWIWALLLFITRIGAASIEVMSDSYFFKHIKSENEEFIGIYRSANPISYIIGPLIAFLILIYIPKYNFIFPILGVLMLYGVYLSSTIRRSDN